MCETLEFRFKRITQIKLILSNRIYVCKEDDIRFHMRNDPQFRWRLISTERVGLVVYGHSGERFYRQMDSHWTSGVKPERPTWRHSSAMTNKYFLFLLQADVFLSLGRWMSSWRQSLHPNRTEP